MDRFAIARAIAFTTVKIGRGLPKDVKKSTFEGSKGSAEGGSGVCCQVSEEIRLKPEHRHLKPVNL